MFFNFALAYFIRKVQTYLYGFKLNGTHPPLINAEYVNILVVSIHITKKITEASIITNKETGLEVNAEKTKYMVMSQDRNIEQNNKKSRRMSGRACSTYRRQVHTKLWWGNKRKQDQLEDPGIDQRIIKRGSSRSGMGGKGGGHGLNQSGSDRGWY